LTGLGVDHALADEIDSDPDAAAPARLVLVAPASRIGAVKDRDALVVIAGPGEAAPSAHPRLEAHDIETATRRWRAVIDRLGPLVGDPSLAELLDGPGDPHALRDKLRDAETRAEEARRAATRLEHDWNDALRARNKLEAELVVARERIRTLESEQSHLALIAEAGAYALADVKPDQRSAVERARIAAAGARLAAALADAAAQTHPRALAWAQATYAGETRNNAAHGLGVLVFRDGAAIIAEYRGEFSDGVRSGAGVGSSPDGFTWTGEWREGEAWGFGVLDAADGRHFEGQVVPDETTGAPRQAAGWIWSAPASTAQSTAPAIHVPAPHALPAPAK
jgi:hypothetical protein